MRYFIKTRDELIDEFGLAFINGDDSTPSGLLWCNNPMDNILGLEINEESYKMITSTDIDGTQLGDIVFITLPIDNAYIREYYIDSYCVIARSEGLEDISQEEITKYKNQLGGFIDEILCED